MTWFDDQALLGRYPALAALAAMVFSGSSRVGDAMRWAAAAEHPSDIPADDPAALTAPDRVLPDSSTLEAWMAVMRLALCREGIDEAPGDAAVADRGLSAQSGFRATALAFEALAALAGGDTEHADALFAHAYSLALDTLRIPAAVAAAALRGCIAADKNNWTVAGDRCREALELVDTWALDDYAESAPAFLLSARIAIRAGDSSTADERLSRAVRLRPLLTYGRPVLGVVTLIEFARAYADFGDTAGAREVVRQARDILKQRPNLGTLSAQLDTLEARIGTMRRARVGASSLTAAELRLVPLLPTHLTFGEIAERLHVARNTAKTQAISIYQKLGVSSRGAAVEQLQILGLLDPSILSLTHGG